LSEIQHKSISKEPLTFYVKKMITSSIIAILSTYRAK